MLLKKISKILETLTNDNRASVSKSFFKTGPGDIFLGVSLPNQRQVVKDHFHELSNFEELTPFLDSKIHEHRSVGLITLVNMFEKTKEEVEKKKIFDYYIKNTKAINNWDLVDLSAPKIVGSYLLDKSVDIRQLLYTWAKSENLWERRLSIVSTFTFIRNKQYDDTIKIGKLLLMDKEDLIHKAVGWMLREVGNKNVKVLEDQFLKVHSHEMPRTMLRYSIEKFSPTKRKHYLNKKEKEHNTTAKETRSKRSTKKEEDEESGDEVSEEEIEEEQEKEIEEEKSIRKRRKRTA